MHLPFNHLCLLQLADGAVVVRPLRAVVWGCRPAATRHRGRGLLRLLGTRRMHLPFNHLCLLAHAEAAVVLGPLRAVVGLARGGVDGGAAGLGRAATTAVAPAPAVVAAAATATSAGDKCLTRESSIAGSLNSSNFFKNHILGPLDGLSRASDDEVLLDRIRRSVPIDLDMCSAGLVDGLDGLAALADDETDLVGGHHHVLHLVPAAATRGPARAPASASTSAATSREASAAAA